MSPREHAWEALVVVLSWVVALVALACVGIYVAVEAIKRGRARRSVAVAGTRENPASSLQMELVA
ncbi:MAG TPA: hypothetical protein VLE97_09765 [Gaiellaceae bacterium]|nr:hypothetical protein [Gaiellaceae bacterium]